jgi:hypothetical protein
MALPTFTPEQRAENLAKAAAARQHRADLKAKLAGGHLTLADVFDMASSSKVTADTKVIDLLKALRGVGEATAKKVMGEVGVAENRRVGGLTPRQKDGLVQELAPVPA